MGLWWPLTSLHGSQLQLNMFSQVAPVSCCWCLDMGSWETGAVGFSFFLVSCPSLSASPPRSALTVSRVLPGLSKAARANVQRSGCLLYFGAGRKRSSREVESCFPTYNGLGMLRVNDSKLPGCVHYICGCIITCSL